MFQVFYFQVNLCFSILTRQLEDINHEHPDETGRLMRSVICSVAINLVSNGALTLHQDQGPSTPGQINPRGKKQSSPELTCKLNQ